MGSVPPASRESRGALRWMGLVVMVIASRGGGELVLGWFGPVRLWIMSSMSSWVEVAATFISLRAWEPVA